MPERPIINLEEHPRHFLPRRFKMTTWDALAPFFEKLYNRSINSVHELEQWLRDCSELNAAINEDINWRQIKMTQDMENEEYGRDFNYFCTDIRPYISSAIHSLHQKFAENPFVEQLDQKKYFTLIRSVRSMLNLYSDDNVPIFSELSVLMQKYGRITGVMTISTGGKEYTLQQATKFYESSNRKLREEVHRKMAKRRMQDRGKLDELFSKMVDKRDTIARNAGFDNFRDYRFQELGRFDYTKEDCFEFHKAVREKVVPLVAALLKEQKKRLQLDVLRPWDVEAEPEDLRPLEPFKTVDELFQKTQLCFEKLRPEFGQYLQIMKEMGRLDLDSRKGKAPGGYNCPLPESGIPFIFMNTTGQMKDVTTFVHEGGHALHTFLSNHLELDAFRSYPMEMAEMASMSMELFSMENWDIFFENPEDLKRAKTGQLERVISIFPWIAMVDKFQHWIYTHPKHSVRDRTAAWNGLQNEYSTEMIDWSGLKESRSCSWQRQLHLFEVPFYYIEYGIAQLGAIAMWKQFKENKEKALDNYVRALSLGYTTPLKELYRTAGIDFDFSSDHIQALVEFVFEERRKLM